MKSWFDHVPTDFRQLAIVVSILAFTALASWLVKRAIVGFSNSKINQGGIAQTTLTFAHRLISAVIYTVGIGAALTHIPELKIVGHSMLAGAGIVTVVGGLASQQILGNVVSGFMIIFFRPFKIGDKITFNSQYTGIVEDITLRETVIRDFENNRVIIPNSKISGEVIVNSNHTDNQICKLIDVGVSYSCDLDQAMALMSETVGAHPLIFDNRTPEQRHSDLPVVTVRVTNLGDSTVNLRAWAWARSASDGYTLQCDSLLNIKKRFDQAGIEIPFPQTTISFQENASVRTSAD